MVVVVAFSSRVRILGECLTSKSPPALFFFFKVEISLCTLIPLFTPGLVHSSLVNWDDCNRVFPDKLCVSSFPDRFPHYSCTAAWWAHSNFFWSKVYACLGVTCHLHFWQNDQGLLRAVTRGWNRHQKRVSTQNGLFRSKFYHHSHLDSNSQPLIMSLALYEQASSRLTWC